MATDSTNEGNVIAEQAAEEPAAEITVPEITVDDSESVELILTAEKLRVYIIAKEPGTIRLTLKKVYGLEVFQNGAKLEPIETEVTDKVFYEFEVKAEKNEIFIQAANDETIWARAKTKAEITETDAPVDETLAASASENAEQGTEDSAIEDLNQTEPVTDDSEAADLADEAMTTGEPMTVEIAQAELATGESVIVEIAQEDLTTEEVDVANTTQEGTTEEPVNAEATDTTTTDEPVVADTTDTVTTDEPAVADTTDTVTTDEPAVADTTDTVTTDEPVATDTTDTVITDEPAVTDTIDTVTTDEPAVTDTTDTVTTDEPVATDTTDTATTNEAVITDTTDETAVVDTAEATDTTETVTTDEPAAADSVEEEPDDEPEDEEPVEEEPPVDPVQMKLDAGYVRVIVIRKNGTNVFAGTDDQAEIVDHLALGDIVWAKPVGGIWAEIYRLDENEAPSYFNLNNVVLQVGEVGYDVPIRKVTLTSTLDGLTEIAEGTEITITAEFSGFTEDEIETITWQYRTPGGRKSFRTIKNANDITYTYAVSAENIHNEWRIILTLKD